jgi:hypothetical protein
MEDGMTRYLLATGLTAIIAAVAAPVVHAQHTAPAGSVSSGSAVPSGGSSGSSSSSGGTSSSSSAGSSSGSSGGNSISDGGSGHRRSNSPTVGTAVPRTNNPGGRITIGAGGFYPWGYISGAGLGIYDGFYGGFYGAYDPWYGFSPVYAPSYASSTSDDNGAIRLKVKPSDASVYVDGYYAGVVDDFDGSFQRLRLQPGPHRIEIRAIGYRPLSLDVMIQPDFTISYRGELGRQ